jgi:DNA-binding SARP family transcriptional activator
MPWPLALSKCGARYETGVVQCFRHGTAGKRNPRGWRKRFSFDVEIRVPLLTLHLLGVPRVERDGAPVEVDTRKAIALLAYLGVTGQPHSRDALAALLWPDYDQTRARATLRRTLSVLGKALGGEWLDAGRETVSLSLQGVWVDVAEFSSRAALRHSPLSSAGCTENLQPLTEAAALYRGDFMAGFTLRDSPTFDDWQFFQAEGLRRELAGALERLTECHAVRGEYEPAIGHARRWLALDPLHEPAHRELMRLFTAAGRRSAALHQYRECVRILEKELGVPPLEETTELYQAIKQNADVRPTIADSSGQDQQVSTHDGVVETSTQPIPTNRQSPIVNHQSSIVNRQSVVPNLQSPLVGRNAEWAALLEAYASIGNDGRLVVLEGEGGIGKTRLAEEFLAHVRGRGAVTIAVRCYEGESDLAYGPVVAGLRHLLAQPANAAWRNELAPHALAEAARLLPELAVREPNLPPVAPLDSPGAQNHFFEGVSQIILAVCRGSTPGVVCIDDLHWADAATLDMLTYFVRRLQGRSVLVLVSWRAEHVPPGTRLRQLLADALRSRSAALISLERLGEDAVEALVQAAGGGALPPDFSARLHRETEGLPLFVVEYLASVAHAPPAGTGWSLPSNVRDVLRSRLATISETAAQILATGAVIGRSFDFDTLREASGRSEEETIAALEQLIARGLVSENRSYGPEGRANGTSVTAPLLPLASPLSPLTPIYDFSHEKLRALVYEETSLARRRLLHRRVADALGGRFHIRRDIGAVAGQIAHHYREAGQDAFAAVHFEIAGNHARALYANAEALAHFRAALALGHPEAAALHEAIGDLHTLLGEYSPALASYETAAALCEPGALAGIERKLGGVHHRRGAWEQAESHYQAALAALGEHGPAAERARVLADWSLTAHVAGGVGAEERAAELARQALDLAEAGGDTHALAQSHNILGVLATGRKHHEAATNHLERSLSLAAQLGDRAACGAALNNLSLARHAQGDLAGALLAAEEALMLASALGDRHREAALHNHLADLLHAAGRSPDAMAHLKQAVAIYAEIGVEAGAVRPEIWKLAEW